VVFATVRPADYSLPYSTLEKNNVAFSAVDKPRTKLLTVMVRDLGCTRRGGCFEGLGCRQWGRGLLSSVDKRSDKMLTVVVRAPVWGLEGVVGDLGGVQQVSLCKGPVQARASVDGFNGQSLQNPFRE
jgi:hypothetical protein